MPLSTTLNELQSHQFPYFEFDTKGEILHCHYELYSSILDHLEISINETSDKSRHILGSSLHRCVPAQRPVNYTSVSPITVRRGYPYKY